MCHYHHCQQETSWQTVNRCYRQNLASINWSGSVPISVSPVTAPMIVLLKVAIRYELGGSAEGDAEEDTAGQESSHTIRVQYLNSTDASLFRQLKVNACRHLGS